MSAKRTAEKAPAEAQAAQSGSDEAENARIAAIVASHWTQIIESDRDAINNGDGDALLAAILSVVQSGIPFPEWLSYKVAAAIRRYTHHETSTLDEAFGVKRPSGYRRRATQDRWRKSYPVVQDILHLHHANIPIDDGLFAAVGERHGVGKTTVSKWFYFHKNGNTVTYRHSCPTGFAYQFPKELLPIRDALLRRK